MTISKNYGTALNRFLSIFHSVLLKKRKSILHYRGKERISHAITSCSRRELRIAGSRIAERRGRRLFRRRQTQYAFECYGQFHCGRPSGSRGAVSCAQRKSMVGVGIETGDIVIIRHQPIAADGDIVAAAINNEVTLKRLVNRPDRIALEAENPEVKPIELTCYDSFRIIGKMVGILKQGVNVNGRE